MKRIIALLLAAAMLVSLTACGGEASSSEKRVFKHGFDLDYPPYSYINEDGTMGGFDVELAQAVCDHLGWEYQAVPFNSDVKTMDDLKGKTVGVQTATSAYDLLNDEEGQAELCKTFASLEVYETYTIAFNDLKAGAIDAIAIDVTSGQYLMSGSEEYKFLDEMLGSEQYAIGFRKEDTELRDTINKALDDLVADGTYAKIGEKYPEIKDFLCLGK